MALYTIELDAATDAEVRKAAAADSVSPEEYCATTLRNLLNGHEEEGEPELSDGAYDALRKMIGFVKADGPTDSSIYHDYRPGDPL